MTRELKTQKPALAVKEGPPRPVAEDSMIPVVKLVQVREDLSPYSRHEPLTGPRDAYKIFRGLFGDSAQEEFWVMTLDAKSRPLHTQRVSQGSLTSTIMHPRECLKLAVQSNASHIIVGHNHPSGNVRPSPEDDNITRRLKEAGEILAIPLWDHLIISPSDFFSYSQEGRILSPLGRTIPSPTHA